MTPAVVSLAFWRRLEGRWADFDEEAAHGSRPRARFDRFLAVAVQVRARYQPGG
ncbi:MAG: hypothetical protein ABI305_13910 [Tepidiformaceae bacterium]